MVATAESQKTRTGGVGLRLDAQSAFERLQEDIGHFAALDPHVAWVQDAVNKRFAELSDDDAVRVAALVWPSLKVTLLPPTCPLPFPMPLPFPGLNGKPDFDPPPPPWQPPGQSWFCIQSDGSLPRPFIRLRHGLVEGEILRGLAERELDFGALTVDALRGIAREIEEWEYMSESSHTREFSQARDEVKRLGGLERKAGVVAAGVLTGAFVAAAVTIAAHMK